MARFYIDKKNSLIFIIIAFIAALYIGYRFIPTFGNYSEGERSGILQKFSNKGFVIKTWEGEMAMEGIRVNSNDAGTTASSVFCFSVLNDSVVNLLKSNVGNKVRVYYHETFHTSWADGDTNYFIDKVEIINN